MNKRVGILILVGIVIIGAIVYLQRQKITPALSGTRDSTIQPITTMDTEAKAKQYDLAKEISTPDGFINTDSINIKDLIGKKVILIDFWTYSCINCQRTTPYLNAWYDKYKDQGLEIIGIHTPEFDFEKVYDNVQKAVTKEGIKFPVVLDNDYSTWQAYGNRYWPRKYLIDIDGYIVYDHIGEGAYDETEQKIQAALKERADRLDQVGQIADSLVKPTDVASVDYSKPLSPEIYFGSGRNEFLANGKQHLAGLQNLKQQASFQANQLYLSGTWNFTDQYAESRSTGSIDYLYQAKHVYLVASASQSMEVEVTLDGKPLGNRAGKDIIVKDGKSYLKVQENRLYEVVSDGEYGQHSLSFTIPGAGLQAYTFTFG